MMKKLAAVVSALTLPAYSIFFFFLCKTFVGTKNSQLKNGKKKRFDYDLS